MPNWLVSKLPHADENKEERKTAGNVKNGNADNNVRKRDPLEKPKSDEWNDRDDGGRRKRDAILDRCWG